MKAAELFQEGQMLLVEGKWKESVEAFTKAIDAGADPYMAHLSRGVARMNLKETALAIDDFTRAITLNASSYRPFYYRGMADLIKGNYSRAIEDFTRVLELKKDHFQARLARSICYSNTGRSDEAANDIRPLIPVMEENVQQFVDEYGIVRTEMWKVMAQLSGERRTPELHLTDKEIETVKEWLGEDED
jgi:tetratricopeptide (TPR) repeat protein